MVKNAANSTPSTLGSGNPPSGTAFMSPTDEDDLLDRINKVSIGADDDDDSAESVTPSTSNARATRASTRSSNNLQGEFELQKGGDIDNLFEFGEEDDKLCQQVPITTFNKGMLKVYCCGYVGANKKTFCLKPRNDCSSHINHGAHFNNKFEPEPDTYYIAKDRTGNKAWCEPCVPSKLLKLLPNADQDILDPSARKTLKVWKGIFNASKSLNTGVHHTSKELHGHVNAFVHPPPIHAMKTPFKHRTASLVNYNKHESSDLADDIKEAQAFVKQENAIKFTSSAVDEQQRSMEQLLLTVHFILDTIKSFEDKLSTKADMSDVSSDVENILAAVAGLKDDVGVNNTSIYTDIWSGLDDLATKVKSEDYNDVAAAVTNLESQFKSVADMHIINNNRWKKLAENWVPTLLKHDRMVTKLSKCYAELMMKPAPSVSLDTLDQILGTGPSDFLLNKDGQVGSTAAKIDSKATANAHQISKQASEIDDLKKSLAKLEMNLAFQDQDKWYQMERCMDPQLRAAGYGVKGVSFGNRYFEDPEAIVKFLKTDMSHPSHGLFVDLPSFIETFGGDRYVERNVTLNDLYLSNKVGFVTQVDSIIAASFQNILPGAYGRRPDSFSGGSATQAELEAQPELPGLTSFDKWDKRDGSSGRKYWIKKESRNTYNMLDNMIRQELKGDVQILAKELLMSSRTMSETLVDFISNTYDDTMYSGRFDAPQAWQMISKFVKRIFIEIADVRVIARNGIRTDDQWTTSGKFVFATLKAHEVMEDFMRLNIKDHPSISSEMVKFICYSQPASDTAEVLNRLGNVETLQRGDQSSISKLEAKLKKLETWKTDAEKALKKARE